MKNYGLPAICRLAVCMAVSTFPFTLFAQHANLDPAGWPALVGSTNNRMIPDTFLIQTFRGTPEDNWGYTIVKNAELFDAKAFGIRNAAGGMCLKLKPGADVIFDPTVTPEQHTGVMLTIPYAVHQLMPGENLHFLMDRHPVVIDKQYLKVPYDNYTHHFGEPRENVLRTSPTVLDGGEKVYNFRFQVSDSSTHSANGFYAFERVCGWRRAAAYTLFTGRGDWKEAGRWSHYQATRNRNALVDGNLTVTGNVQCDSLLLGRGSVYIAPGNHLYIRELLLNGPDVSLVVAGDLHVKERVCYQLSLPETGKWYFVSFPFDVYADGVDTGFRLGDGQTTEGNFFYLKTYDGDQRNRSKKATGNWKTVPADTGGDGKPVFRQGQGYLIALDKKATRKMLQFSGRHDRLPAAFGREGRISLHVSPASGGTDTDHHGWALCGNPLPAPLPLTAIEDNPALDGSVYLYNGQEYQAYPIGSNEVLPPLAAFFVKAKQDTELVFRSAVPATKGGMATASLRPFQALDEPLLSTATGHPRMTDAATSIRMSEGGIEVDGLTAPASLQVIDLTGRVLATHSLSAGSTRLPLYLSPGVYLLQIRSDKDRIQYKVVWNN